MTTEHTSTLLMFSTERPGRILASRNGLVTRIATRLMAPHLDRLLAEGVSPESNRLLAARAQVLVSPAARQELAFLWGNLLTAAAVAPVMRSPRAVLNRECVVGCAERIEEIRAGFTAARPISARSVAMATILLTDGTGPVYDRRDPGRLWDALGEISEELVRDFAPQSLSPCG